MAVRTKRLVSTSFGGDTLLYTTPAGHTTILKWFHFFTASSPATTFTVRVDTGIEEVILRQHTLGPNLDFSYEDYVVLQPGFKLRVRMVGAWNPCYAYISGSELLGVA